jgi:hypothetical protein
VIFRKYSKLRDLLRAADENELRVLTERYFGRTSVIAGCPDRLR